MSKQIPFFIDTSASISDAHLQELLGEMEDAVLATERAFKKRFRISVGLIVAPMVIGLLAALSGVTQVSPTVGVSYVIASAISMIAGVIHANREGN